jgi:hypothetical protein
MLLNACRWLAVRPRNRRQAQHVSPPKGRVSPDMTSVTAKTHACPTARKPARDEKIFSRLHAIPHATCGIRDGVSNPAVRTGAGRPAPPAPVASNAAPAKGLVAEAALPGEDSILTDRSEFLPAAAYGPRLRTEWVKGFDRKCRSIVSSHDGVCCPSRPCNRRDKSEHRRQQPRSPINLLLGFGWASYSAGAT